MRKDSRTDIGRILGLDQRRNGYVQAERRMDHIAEDMMINFFESGHPAFRGPSVLYEDLCQAKEEEHCLYISVVMLKQ